MSVPVQLFLYTLKLIHQQNPMLLLSEDEPLPEEFCRGISFPITCIRYNVGETKNVFESLQVSKNSPIFLSKGDHKDLVMEFSRHPNLFSRTSVWFFPLGYESSIPLRLDSRVFLYEGAKSDGYTVYESYSMRGRTQTTRKLLEWSPKMASDAANVFEKRSILRERANLNGEVLKNSWFEQHPFVVYKKDVSGAIVGTAGYYSEILSQLAVNLNFTLKHIPGKYSSVKSSDTCVTLYKQNFLKQVPEVD